VKRFTTGVAVLAVVCSAPAVAQETPADLLAQAKTLYEQLEVERVIPVLRRVLSPSVLLTVSPAQRAEASTYLGAAFALTGQRDSAVFHFRNALQWDPFTDLDPTRFTPAQASLFVEARRRIFAVGIRPAPEATLDPRTEPAVFTFVTTHSARVRTAIRRSDSAAATETQVTDGDVSGLHQARWDLLINGRLAPPGRYALVVVASSRVLTRTDTALVYFTLEHLGESPEDTIPELGPGQLLAERGSRRTASRGLFAGLGVALGALVLSEGLTSDDLGGGRTPGRLLAATAAGTGVVTFLNQRKGRDMPENVAENARRRGARADSNVAIRQRNAERVARTRVLIAPAAGAEP
jgi:hypothetical protein